MDHTGFNLEWSLCKQLQKAAVNGIERGIKRWDATASLRRPHNNLIGRNILNFIWCKYEHRDTAPSM